MNLPIATLRLSVTISRESVGEQERQSLCCKYVAAESTEQRCLTPPIMYELITLLSMRLHYSAEVVLQPAVRNPFRSRDGHRGNADAVTHDV